MSPNEDAGHRSLKHSSVKRIRTAGPAVRKGSDIEDGEVSESDSDVGKFLVLVEYLTLEKVFFR